MSRVQVVFVDRIVRPLRGFVRLRSQRAPSVRHKSVDVVDRFNAVEWQRTTKQHGARAEERLDVAVHVAKRSPDNMRDSALAAKPRERCSQLVRIHRINIAR